MTTTTVSEKRKKMLTGCGLVKWAAQRDPVEKQWQAGVKWTSRDLKNRLSTRQHLFEGLESLKCVIL